MKPLSNEFRACREWLRHVGPLFLLAALLGLVALSTGCQSTSIARTPKTTPLPKPVIRGRPPPEATPPRAPKHAASLWRQEAGKWLGTPYRLGGADHNGIDCSGFVAQLHRTVARRNLSRTTQAQFQASVPVTLDAALPGDLIFFSTTGPGVTHVGLLLDGGQFAHASTSRGVMISSMRERYWVTRFRGVRRPK